MSEENVIQLQPQPQAEGNNPSSTEDSTKAESKEKNRKTVNRPTCEIATAQAPIQACLRPGMWLPGVRNLHMARETWSISASLQTAVEKLVAGIGNIDTEEDLKVHKVDHGRNYVEIFAFTPGCNWLDVVEVKLRQGDTPESTIGEATSFSSGVFPAWIPLAFLCNACCCYVPFSGNGMNTKRLQLIREALDLPVQVTAETKCNCCPS